MKLVIILFFILFPFVSLFSQTGQSNFKHVNIIKGYKSTTPEILENSSENLPSDVDRDIPDVGRPNNNRYALVIGNQDYTSKQVYSNKQPNVDFAKDDARAFSKYCVKTLGVPKEQLIELYDATSGQITSMLTKLNSLIKKTEGRSEIFFYYAGHGVPDENTHEPYLMPVDVGGILRVEFKLSNIYKQLTEFPAQKVTVFLDACFSGGGRSQGLIASRGIKIKPKESLLNGNIVIFSASSGEQSASAYKDKRHGLFTYFLLKKIQETKGDITYSELYESLKEIGVQSVKVNNNEQDPQLLSSEVIGDSWKKWKLR